MKTNRLSTQLGLLAGLMTIVDLVSTPLAFSAGAVNVNPPTTQGQRTLCC